MSGISNRDLMNYITLVKNLEVSVYEQQKVLANLNNSFINRYSSKEFKQREEHVPFWGMLFGCCILCIFCSVVIAAVGSFFWNYKWGGIITSLFVRDTLFGPMWKAIKMGCFIGIALGIPLAFIFWVHDIYDVKNRNREIDRYNIETDRDNRANAQAITRRNELLSREIEFVKNNLDKTNRILTNVYAMNVIHEKYRNNIVYICSIYEYFDTGICNKLEGHEGAYNLLEADIKYQNIIDKLDVIIRKLDDIRDRQRELYTAIDNTNRSIQQINSSINQLSGTMNNVQDSLNQIEYNSRISMQNGEFLKWYVYFRN